MYINMGLQSLPKALKSLPLKDLYNKKSFLLLCFIILFLLTKWQIPSFYLVSTFQLLSEWNKTKNSFRGTNSG